MLGILLCDFHSITIRCITSIDLLYPTYSSVQRKVVSGILGGRLLVQPNFLFFVDTFIYPRPLVNQGDASEIYIYFLRIVQDTKDPDSFILLLCSVYIV